MTPASVARWKALVAVVVWGASFPSSKIAVAEVSFYTLIWLRIGLGAAFMVAYLVVRGKLRPLPPREVLVFASLGFLGIFFHNSMQAYALQSVPAGLSGLIIAANPIAIAMLGALILRERLSAPKMVGILLAACGVVAIISHGDIFALFGRDYALGELLMVCSVFTWGLFSVLSRKALQRTATDIGMACAQLFGFLFATIPFVIMGGAAELPSISVKGWSNIIFLGLLCSGLAYLLWYDALKALPASEVGVFLYVNPVVAVIISALFLDEPVTASMLFGGLLVFSGVWFVNRASARL